MTTLPRATPSYAADRYGHRYAGSTACTALQTPGSAATGLQTPAMTGSHEIVDQPWLSVTADAALSGATSTVFSPINVTLHAFLRSILSVESSTAA